MSRLIKRSVARSRLEAKRVEARQRIVDPTRLMSEPVRTLQLDCFPVCLQWAPSGAFLAIGGDDGDIRFIDPHGVLAARFPAHAGGVTSLAWHPMTGELATTGHDRKVLVWTQGDGGTSWTSQQVYTAQRSQMDMLAWSQTQRWLAIADGKQVMVATSESASGGEPLVLQALGELPSSVTGLRFSPQGTMLGAAAFGGVTLFSLPSRAATRLEWKGSMLGIEFSPDGTVVACGCQDNSVHFWRIASGKDAQMSGYPMKPNRLTFSSNGKYLATNGEASICLWPFDGKGPEGRKPVVLEGHGSPVTELAYAPMVDLLLSGDRDGMLALWTPPSLKSPAVVHRLSGKIAAVGWGVDAANEKLRWAAADQNGTMLLGLV